MAGQPDFTGDPPDYWWSDLDEPSLIAELEPLMAIALDGATIVNAWTEEPQGPAFVSTSDGRTFRVAGDGRVTVWEEIAPPKPVRSV